MTDRIRDADMGWSALCPLEARVASYVCWNRAASPAEAAQAMAAYFFLASCRMNSEGTATVPDKEVAEVVPKLRGAGYLTPSGYCKGVKRRLREWGLVSYQDAPQNGRRGREPTVYGFPMLDEHLGIAAWEVRDEVSSPE